MRRLGTLQKQIKQLLIYLDSNDIRCRLILCDTFETYFKYFFFPLLLILENIKRLKEDSSLKHFKQKRNMNRKQ